LRQRGDPDGNVGQECLLEWLPILLVPGWAGPDRSVASAEGEVEVIDLGLESGTSGDWAILEVKGEVDLYTSPQLREGLAALIDRGERQILVDLTGVDFMDSSGLGVLVASLKR